MIDCQVQRAPRVLIVENDFLIGEMIHDMVAGLGYQVTKVAHQFPSALKEISKENFDAALVNIGIDQAKHVSDIADILIAKTIPFAFVTGYGHAFEDRHKAIPLLQKPFNQDQLRALLEMLVGPSGSEGRPTQRECASPCVLKVIAISADAMASAFGAGQSSDELSDWRIGIKAESLQSLLGN